MKLSARKKDDKELISELANTPSAGLVIIDDFHRLEPKIQEAIADHLKVLADEERVDTKLIIVGINRVGDSLVNFAPDLNNRIDTIRFEANPDERVRRLVEQGEAALNVEIGIKNDIVRAASGSFYVAQMLCHETCIASQVTESQAERGTSTVSFQVVVYRVMANLSRTFMQPAITFAAGPRLRREGRAPYLHILKWLAEADEWSIMLTREVAKHPEQRGSTGQVVEKGYLKDFLDNKPELARIIHFQQSTSILTVEDPQFVFFLRNLGWNKFAEQVGFLNIQFSARYDFALSFAGANRETARKLFELLAEHELEVFYDENEQSRILAENIEDYLGPIYSSEASYVVCLLSPEYPKRVWTTFESQQFKSRFGQRAVIPVWYTTAPPGTFDESSRVGGITFDPSHNQEAQLQNLAELLRDKIKERIVAAVPQGTREEPSEGGWPTLSAQDSDLAGAPSFRVRCERVGATTITDRYAYSSTRDPYSCLRRCRQTQGPSTSLGMTVIGEV